MSTPPRPPSRVVPIHPHDLSHPAPPAPAGGDPNAIVVLSTGTTGLTQSQFDTITHMYDHLPPQQPTAPPPRPATFGQQQAAAAGQAVPPAQAPPAAHPGPSGGTQAAPPAQPAGYVVWTQRPGGAWTAVSSAAPYGVAANIASGGNFLGAAVRILPDGQHP